MFQASGQPAHDTAYHAQLHPFVAPFTNRQHRGGGFGQPPAPAAANADDDAAQGQNKETLNSALLFAVDSAMQSSTSPPETSLAPTSSSPDADFAVAARRVVMDAAEADPTGVCQALARIAEQRIRQKAPNALGAAVLAVDSLNAIAVARQPSMWAPNAAEELWRPLDAGGMLIDMLASDLFTTKSSTSSALALGEPKMYTRLICLAVDKCLKSAVRAAGARGQAATRVTMSTLPSFAASLVNAAKFATDASPEDIATNVNRVAIACCALRALRKIAEKLEHVPRYIVDFCRSLIDLHPALMELDNPSSDQGNGDDDASGAKTVSSAFVTTEDVRQAVGQMPSTTLAKVHWLSKLLRDPTGGGNVADKGSYSNFAAMRIVDHAFDLLTPAVFHHKSAGDMLLESMFTSGHLMRPILNNVRSAYACIDLYSCGIGKLSWKGANAVILQLMTSICSPPSDDGPGPVLRLLLLRCLASTDYLEVAVDFPRIDDLGPGMILAFEELSKTVLPKSTTPIDLEFVIGGDKSFIRYDFLAKNIGAEAFCNYAVKVAKASRERDAPSNGMSCGELLFAMLSITFASMVSTVTIWQQCNALVGDVIDVVAATATSPGGNDGPQAVTIMRRRVAWLLLRRMELEAGAFRSPEQAMAVLAAAKTTLESSVMHTLSSREAGPFVDGQLDLRLMFDAVSNLMVQLDKTTITSFLGQGKDSDFEVVVRNLVEHGITVGIDNICFSEVRAAAMQMAGVLSKLVDAPPALKFAARLEPFLRTASKFAYQFNAHIYKPARKVMYSVDDNATEASTGEAPRGHEGQVDRYLAPDPNERELLAKGERTHGSPRCVRTPNIADSAIHDALIAFTNFMATVRTVAAPSDAALIHVTTLLATITRHNANPNQFSDSDEIVDTAWLEAVDRLLLPDIDQREKVISHQTLGALRRRAVESFNSGTAVLCLRVAVKLMTASSSSQQQEFGLRQRGITAAADYVHLATQLSRGTHRLGLQQHAFEISDLLSPLWGQLVADDKAVLRKMSAIDQAAIVGTMIELNAGSVALAAVLSIFDTVEPTNLAIQRTTGGGTLASNVRGLIGTLPQPLPPQLSSAAANLDLTAHDKMMAEIEGRALLVKEMMRLTGGDPSIARLTWHLVPASEYAEDCAPYHTRLQWVLRRLDAELRSTLQHSHELAEYCCGLAAHTIEYRHRAALPAVRSPFNDPVKTLDAFAIARKGDRPVAYEQLLLHRTLAKDDLKNARDRFAGIACLITRLSEDFDKQLEALPRDEEASIIVGSLPHYFAIAAMDAALPACIVRFLERSDLQTQKAVAELLHDEGVNADAADALRREAIHYASTCMTLLIASPLSSLPVKIASRQQQQQGMGGFGQPAGGFGLPAGGFGQPAGGFGQQAGGFGQQAGGFGPPPRGFGGFGRPAGGPRPARPTSSPAVPSEEPTVLIKIPSDVGIRFSELLASRPDN